MAQKIMSHRKKDQKDSKKEGNSCSHMSYLQQRLDKRKRRYFVPSTSERTIKRSVFISTASRAAKLSLSLTLITWNAGEKSWVNYTVQKEVHRSTQPGSAGPPVCKTPFSGNPPFQTCTFLSIDIHKPCSQQHLQSRSHPTRWRKPSDSRRAWAPLVRTPLAPNFHLVRVRLAVLVHAAPRGVSVSGMLDPLEDFTHIYPLEITIGLSRGDNSIIRVDNGDDVHSEELVKCPIEVPALLFVVEIQIGHQDLQGLNRSKTRGRGMMKFRGIA